MESPNRVIPGAQVNWRGRKCIVLDIPAVDRVIVRDVVTGVADQAPTAELFRVAKDVGAREDLMVVADADWREALSRFEAIAPLLNERRETRRDVDAVRQVAKNVGVNMATIYRWMAKYEAAPYVTTLLRNPRRDRGMSRLAPETEKLLNEVIQTFYLTKQRPSMSETCEEVARRFREASIEAPHPNTVRNRISQISEKLRLTKRVSAKAAREKFMPHRGAFPGANVPLSVVQIDHTPVDLMLVDDGMRLPIGRPYLTIAIDVCTRMIAGFCITLDPPGAMSAGLAIADAILPKDERLAAIGIAESWPIWGMIGKIHVDNAKEFRGTMLARACAEHGITLEFRPKGLPNYGGTVERAFLTFMKKTHGIAGTTFSNIKEKGGYDPDKRASMTLSEFERWFTTFILMVYHQKPHRGLAGRVPIKLFEQYTLGADDQPGIGTPLRYPDEKKLRLDFTPWVERTVQEYGVLIDGIHYYADTLRPYIHAVDPNNSKLKRKFIFARDPRDISTIHFFDPHTRNYVRRQNIWH